MPNAGLTLFCVVPTTLGVGISLVRSCKGNEALALFLTVVTNVVAIFIMPFWLKAMFSDSSGLNLHFDITTMFVKLLITVLVPALIGKVRGTRSPTGQQGACTLEVAPGKPVGIAAPKACSICLGGC